MESRWVTRGSLFVTVLLIGLGYFATQAHAEESSDSVVVEEKRETEQATKDEVKKIEIYDTAAWQALVEEIVMNDPLYQLNNKSSEELKRDLNNASISYQGLDMNKLGIQDIVLVIKFEAGTKFSVMPVNTIRKNLRIEFVDTTAPVLELNADDVWLRIGTEFNLEDYISELTDNSLQKPTTVEVVGKIDIETEGSYEIKLQVSDGSGNICEKELTVHVVNFLQRASSRGSQADMSDLEYFLSLVNAEREALGIEPLVLGCESGQGAASLRAVEASEYLSHDRPDGTRYKTALDEYGVSYTISSEVLTIAGNSTYDKFAWWMSSPNHRAILLDASFNHIAIGTCGELWAALLYFQ